LRRECQLRNARPDLKILSLRGNVNTRLRKLDEGEFDAIILASSGLKRLEMHDRIRQCIPAEVSLPAGGQGALGIETRLGDERMQALLEPLHHAYSADCVVAERALNRRLEGGCQVPIACFAIEDNGELWLRGLVGKPDGSVMLTGEARAPRAEAEALGIQVAEDLLAQGAGEILAAVYGDSA